MSTDNNKKGFPFELILFVLIPVLIAGGIMLAVRTLKEGPAEEIDQNIVRTYIEMITHGRYDEAYDLCLTNEYRNRMSREEFAEAHRSTREKRGALLSRVILLIKQGRNLFSGIEDIQLTYRLNYEKGEWRSHLTARGTGSEWRIDGTYRRAARHLEPKVW